MERGLDSRDFATLARSLRTKRGSVPGVLPGTTSSAPSAVLVIAFFGGDAVMPHRHSFAAPHASVVRKNDPTLYMLRTFSSTIDTGSCPIPS